MEFWGLIRAASGRGGCGLIPVTARKFLEACDEEGARGNWIRCSVCASWGDMYTSISRIISSSSSSSCSTWMFSLEGAIAGDGLDEISCLIVMFVLMEVCSLLLSIGSGLIATRPFPDGVVILQRKSEPSVYYS